MCQNNSGIYGKILFLWLNNEDFHALNASRRGVKIARTYKKISAAMKVFRRIHLFLKLPGSSYWFESWKAHINRYETIIVQDSILFLPVVRYIRKVNQNVRIIVWYWNPVNKTSVSPNEFYKYNVKIWSFDEEDCKKYKIEYNTQYYFNDLTIDNSTIDQDIFFVGGDKGRLEALIELQNKIRKLNITSYFHVTSGAGSLQLPLVAKKGKYESYYKQKISYDEVLKYIGKSKAILDYISEGQTGLTIRPLEALFFQKKLITNDFSIVKRDFYNPQNIFIIGMDDLAQLPIFLSSPFIAVEKSICDKYDFEKWMERFFEGATE